MCLSLERPLFCLTPLLRQVRACSWQEAVCCRRRDACCLMCKNSFHSFQHLNVENDSSTESEAGCPLGVQSCRILFVAQAHTHCYVCPAFLLYITLSVSTELHCVQDYAFSCITCNVCIIRICSFDSVTVRIMIKSQHAD